MVCFVLNARIGAETPKADLSGAPTFVVKDFKQGDDLKIIAYGDMRFTDPANTYDTNPRVRKWLVDRIAQERPDALFVSGDLPFRGGVAADWQRYHEETEIWKSAALRVYPTIGNHELVPEEDFGLPNYFAEFPWLGERYWYSVQIGSVYLIALDSNTRYQNRTLYPGSPQWQWLDAQLAHLPREVNFVFFLIHMPLINDMQSEVIADLPESREIKLRHYLEEKSKQAHAKFVVVSGHVHNYERFEHGGVSYIVSGGGGAKPYPVYVRSPEDLYHDPGFPNFNYVVLKIHGKQADATMYRVIDPKAAVLGAEPKDVFTLQAK
jgi:hypothetical protein